MQNIVRGQKLKLNDIYVKDIAEKLAEFSKASPDCNYTEMTRDLMEFLKGVMEADGKIDEREEFAIEKIDAIFKEAGRAFSKANIEMAKNTAQESLRKGKDAVERSAEKLSNTGKTILKKFRK